MIPNPIRRVLSSIAENRVRALLMGGQACILYGAAEFSRDTDLAILASPANLKRLEADWRAQTRHRPLLTHSRPGHERKLEAALMAEERAEREADARYWEPLKVELEQLRHDRLKP